jgi:hypothetical protein
MDVRKPNELGADFAAAQSRVAAHVPCQPVRDDYRRHRGIDAEARLTAANTLAGSL